MDPSRPLLLGLLAAAAACASWTPGAEFADPARPQAFEPRGETRTSCASIPDLRLSGERVFLLSGCDPQVAVFRRDVLAGSETELLGSCELPCADMPGVGVFAYSIAPTDAEGLVGEPTPEIFVSVETSTDPR
jgi:hypothetical protein